MKSTTFTLRSRVPSRNFRHIRVQFVITGISPLLITIVVIAFALPMSHFVSIIFRKNGDESLSLLSLLLVPMFPHNATLTRRQISVMKQSARRTCLEYHLPRIHYGGGIQFVIKIGQNF